MSPKSEVFKSSENQMLRGALIPTLIVGLIALITFTWRNGKSGLVGALLAQIIVIIFFVVHILISMISRNLDPIMTMALAMFSYFAKVLLLGAALAAIAKFTTPDTINRIAFGITAIALTFAWLGGEIRSYFKLRVTLPLPRK
jgi:hypothetical protein